ncbi:MAG: shikimate kinase [Lachnospiraceae bacterium]
MDVKEKKYKNEKNIMLIGFMGAGKTTVSRELTRLTGKSEVDMDAYIVQNEGRSINEIFEKQGEAYFRQLETKYLGEIQKNSGYIVSCGGGAVLKDENVRLMKENGVIILLTATPETTLLRVQNSKDRPILNGNMNIEFITQLMDKRKDRYLEVADIIVETDNKAVRAIADEILEKYSLFCKK